MVGDNVGAVDGLVDRFGRRVTYLRLSVTDRCNFRCVYCMPAEGVKLCPSKDLLTFEEIRVVVETLASHGVRRVRVTGGEPLVRKQLPELIASLKAIEGIDEVVMTTNGYLLGRDAVALREAGLDGLTVSLDSLQADRFSKMSRGGSLERVLESMELASQAGFERIKINAVVIRGFNDDEVLDMIEWSLERGHLLRLIEFMPIGADTFWSDGNDNGCVPAAEMQAVIGTRWAMEPLGMKTGAGPARYWGLKGPASPDGQGRVGIISAVTQCFCDSCNRIRLTPQGGLRACLADDSEVDLRAVLRGGEGPEGVYKAVARSLWGKAESHSFDLEGGAVTMKQMVSIGG